ncbi:hypothetical protein AVEN_254509-1 [Araneus ventricosus]|uniref:Uncharacterized protein n=1 Tax=Araneus ventricosus TaxID=182803 RepID=A0A4Y2RJY5_ARAVE|nr:hypothetical protein AVEN_254509-1 [Araneus ventricosus]
MTVNTTFPTASETTTADLSRDTDVPTANATTPAGMSRDTDVPTASETTTADLSRDTDVPTANATTPAGMSRAQTFLHQPEQLRQAYRPEMPTSYQTATPAGMSRDPGRLYKAKRLRRKRPGHRRSYRRKRLADVIGGRHRRSYCKRERHRRTSGNADVLRRRNARLLRACRETQTFPTAERRLRRTAGRCRRSTAKRNDS